jgi:type IV fimbrial biogenesis protein FimT
MRLFSFKANTTMKAAQRGYTLVELMVSIGVLTILGAVALPGMENIMLNNSRVSLTNEFSSSLQVARSEAATRNQRVTMCASGNGTSCGSASAWKNGWIVFNDVDLSGAPNGDELIIKDVRSDGEIDIIPDTFAASITYRPNGRAMADTIAENTGEFTFCDRRGAEHARVLIVGSNGRPQLSESSADGSAPECD